MMSHRLLSLTRSLAHTQVSAAIDEYVHIVSLRKTGVWLIIAWPYQKMSVGCHQGVDLKPCTAQKCISPYWPWHIFFTHNDHNNPVQFGNSGNGNLEENEVVIFQTLFSTVFCLLQYSFNSVTCDRLTCQSFGWLIASPFVVTWSWNGAANHNNELYVGRHQSLKASFLRFWITRKKCWARPKTQT